jgi:hypothetical protein
VSARFKLAEFQQAAVDHIVTRLKDRRGSQRFLLADEVGLGKTFVARGVIDALVKGRRSPLKVIYLCSNSEIAEQNRPKLADDSGISVGRATELALHRVNPNSRIELFAFTPGTSLRGGTGMARERRLMLFLLHRLFGIDVSTKRWRKYFQCSAGEDRWLRDTKWSSVSGEFSWATSRSFQDALAGALRLARHEGDALRESLLTHVSHFDECSLADRRRRNGMVSTIRELMQRVALRALEPDLVVIDEVQRFKDVIDEANNAERIASELFQKGVPVLILSATPYRLLTLEHEVQESGSQHHEDFFRTLDFLFAPDRVKPARVRKNLEQFGTRLRCIDLDATRDSQLLQLKRAIENDLRQVICRTERNWYSLDAKQGIAEHGQMEHSLPGRGELREFFEIHQGLAKHLDGVGLVTDFWKSSPSLLTFMDAGYALIKKLRAKKVRVPRGLLSAANDPTLPQRNLRFRRLIDHALGSSDALPLLWTRPSYTYHRDKVYGERFPRKMLVFSGWRFVPKAIAVVVSNAASSRLPGVADETRQPLRFTEKWSFHVFDACFPSWALAALVNPRALRSDGVSETPSAEECLASALSAVRRRLTEVHVEVVKAGANPLWQTIARLEATSGHVQALRTALRQWTGPEDSATDATERHRERMLEWLQNTETQLRISEADLEHLALIAVASPATSLLRAIMSVFPEKETADALPRLLSLCFGELRSYLNRPLVQQIIRRHRPHVFHRKRRGRAKRGFAERVLAYALDHHLLAVLDEHAFLLRNAASCSTVTKVIEHFQSVWSLGRGSRRTNGSLGRGQLVRIGQDAHSWPTHFALAFGEDSTAEVNQAGEDEQRMRRSEVREAFNSPFWPFVLATTSVGQEGLDFHLHCRDVFHWNLPSNPVDLEQREGRINRRDSLAVRQSIAKDWSIDKLADALRAPNGNPWITVFERLEADHSSQRYKHGLYPHWIYECHDPAHTVGIERHVAFFEASHDSYRYERLKTALALYRLVFGQANQGDLLGDLEDRLQSLSPGQRTTAKRRLAGYMLSLSPIGSAEAMKFANIEARQLLDTGETASLLRLVAEVRRIVANHPTELAPAMQLIGALTSRIEEALATGDRKSHKLRKAVTALAYLRNPYDQFFDGQSVGGFDDDIKVLRKATGMSGRAQ